MINEALEIAGVEELLAALAARSAVWAGIGHC
jgi:hypothetical protein